MANQNKYFAAVVEAGVMQPNTKGAPSILRSKIHALEVGDTLITVHYPLSTEAGKSTWELLLIATARLI